MARVGWAGEGKRKEEVGKGSSFQIIQFKERIMDLSNLWADSII